jgi:uncharacterized protein (TIGR02453 family)
MAQISPATFSFLTELKSNNDREWFAVNKKRYEAAKVDFDVFVEALLREIVVFDPSISHFSAKECVFRIYRDVRFGKDKSPYKTHFGAHVTSAAKKSELHTKAGYYIHLEPGGVFLAGGAYMPEGPWLKAIRSEIHYNGTMFHAIIDNPDFRRYFGAIEGEKLKTTPKDYQADHPDIEILKHKSFVATHKCTDKVALSPDFVKHCAAAFKVLKPFDDFLNMAKD